MIRAIVLAAGASSRMGSPKAALPLGSTGQTALSTSVSTLLSAGLPHVVVVAGAHLEATRAALSAPLGSVAPGRRVERRVQVVDNAQWQRGQLSSLLTGLDAADDPQLEGLLVTLVDVPLVSESTVRAVIAAWRRTRAPIVRPADGDRHGHPVVFDRSVFEELRKADLTVGAKAIFAAHRLEILDVPVADPGAFDDLDTPEDYERIKRYRQTG